MNVMKGKNQQKTCHDNINMIHNMTNVQIVMNVFKFYYEENLRNTVS